VEKQQVSKRKVSSNKFFSLHNKYTTGGKEKKKNFISLNVETKRKSYQYEMNRLLLNICLIACKFILCFTLGILSTTKLNQTVCLAYDVT